MCLQGEQLALEAPGSPGQDLLPPGEALVSPRPAPVLQGEKPSACTRVGMMPAGHQGQYFPAVYKSAVPNLLELSLIQTAL